MTRREEGQWHVVRFLLGEGKKERDGARRDGAGREGRGGDSEISMIL